MTSARVRIRRWIVLLALLPALALADKRDYAKGVEAAEDADWAKVQQLMGSALAADPQPVDRALMYGTYRRPYIPQYYLALAAFNRNDCTAAMRLLGDARLTALLATGGRAAAEATELAAIRKRCATPISSTQPPPLDTTAPPPPSLSAAQRQSAQRALESLQQAVTQARAKVPLAQLSAALTQSAQAQAALENAVLSGEAANLQRALTLARDAGTELSRLTRSAGSVVQAPATPPTPPATPPATPPPPPARAEPAAGLKSALAAFIAGDYQSVQRATTAGMDGRSSGHTLLLRAAARYSLFLLSGEREASLLTMAEADVREARRTLPGIGPSAGFFSPRFVSFFERTR